MIAPGVPARSRPVNRTPCVTAGLLARDSAGAREESLDLECEGH